LVVTYRGQPVKRLELFHFELRNTGSRPIRPSDFTEEVRVTVPGKILSAYCVVGPPRPLVGKVDVERDTVVVRRLLLNQGDKLLFNVLSADGSAHQLSYLAEGHVEGIPAIQARDFSRFPPHQWGYREAFLLSLMAASLAALVALRYRRKAGIGAP
jgi:hypothetical protein